MTNMFSFSFALVFLIFLTVHGQNNNLNPLPLNGVEKVSLFSQLHRLIDNQNQDQLTIPSCVRVRPNIKNAYPPDNTKYYICRDEQRYEILTCANGGIFDDRQKACIDLCEQKKPCLNQGQCIILSNLTLECVCRRDWTGERCEIPLSTCATNPCGPNAECRMLKTTDYTQDYVCICNNHQSYGRNCQQTVPNPCLANIQQFHPFAFSRHAYINCDDEVIFFQPCNSRLYWNQEEKRCDRVLPLLLRAPFLNIKTPNERKQHVQLDTVKPTQWQRVQDNQQQQNFLTLPQDFSNRQWSNQVPDVSAQTNQRFPIQSQPWQGSQTIQNQPLSQGQNQQFLTNAFMETTTAAPRIFHLKGFANRNSEQQNTQWQDSQLMSNQPSLQGQNQQTLTAETIPRLQTMFQQNTQLRFNQQQQQQQQAQNGQSTGMTTPFSSQTFPVLPRPDQMTTSSFETTTTAANKDVQEGLFTRTLLGWKSNQQEPVNQIDQQKLLNTIPGLQARSWKA